MAQGEQENNSSNFGLWPVATVHCPLPTGSGKCAGLRLWTAGLVFSTHLD